MVDPTLQLSGELLSETEKARLDRLLRVLFKTDLEQLPDGKYTIDDQTLFFYIQTAPKTDDENPLFEAHTVRADIQYLISGTLIMDFCKQETLSRPGFYDEENDITFYAQSGNYTRISIPERVAVVIMPCHGHRTIFPKGAPAGSFRRVIGKLQLDASASP